MIFNHKHAANLLEALRALDLLKVAIAIVTNNFVLTIDEASTSIARQTLDDIVSNLTYHSFVLIGSVTPLHLVAWEYLNRTPRNVVTTLTVMQLVKMTSALLESISRFLQRDTLNIHYRRHHQRIASSNRSDTVGDTMQAAFV